MLRAAVADAEAAIAEARGKQGYVVSAPVSGRVNSLQAWVGMNTETGVPFMSIVPDNAPLEVTLLVPVRAIGLVARNQQVKVAFDPFPFQRFGLHRATIISVSNTLLKPGESAAPIAPKEPSYRVTARLERQTITAYGDEVALRPDTTLRADIVFDRLQTGLAYELSSAVLRHLLRLPLAYFEKRRTGDLLSRFAATDPIRDMLTEGVMSAAVDGVWRS